MSSLQLQRVFFNALPQLTESQRIKLLEFIQALMPPKKAPKTQKLEIQNPETVKVLTDETFLLDQADLLVKIPFRNSFSVPVQVISIEKHKPTIVLE